MEVIVFPVVFEASYFFYPLLARNPRPKWAAEYEGHFWARGRVTAFIAVPLRVTAGHTVHTVVLLLLAVYANSGACEVSIDFRLTWLAECHGTSIPRAHLPGLQNSAVLATFSVAMRGPQSDAKNGSAPW